MREKLEQSLTWGATYGPQEGLASVGPLPEHDWHSTWQQSIRVGQWQWKHVSDVGRFFKGRGGFLGTALVWANKFEQEKREGDGLNLVSLE